MTHHPAVLVITSHVVRGRIGARACAFALERLGFPTWIVPTVTLPWHPGHGKAARLVPDETAFSDLIEDLKTAPWLSEIGAIVTGYLGHASQARPIADLITAIQNSNPDVLYCCDPVIGDASGLYVPDETAFAIRDHLLPLADVLVPNRYEFNWLVGTEFESNEQIVAAAQTMKADRVAVTSAFPIMRQSAATLLVERDSDSAVLAEHRDFPEAPNGLGDLFSGLLTGRLLQNMRGDKALEASVSGVFDVLARTIKAGADELLLVEEQGRLERPMAMVNLRRISGNVVTKKRVVVKPTPLV